MNRYIQNILSLVIIVLVSILSLEYYDVISMESLMHDGLSYATVSIIIIFATASICQKSSNLNKFLGYLTLILIFCGITGYIVTGDLNILLFSGVGFATLDAFINILYKNI